ncbi:MAG: SDR family oxidoreductase [Myxococcales bacterium]|nr:SDR family oxidoreductase [Myxococcales bacterium]
MSEDNDHRGDPEQVAVITGASVGIGRAIAELLRGDGLRVINLARRACPVDGVLSVPVDLSSGAGVKEAAAQLRARLPGGPRVLHLVHNAAAMPQDSASALDPASFERAMRLNVISPAELTAELLPLMAPGSSVIYIGSTLSEKGVPGRLSYVASKHAVLGLLRATVQDLFGTGVHAVCVCPGFTDTEMLRPVLDENPELMRAVLDMVSYHRLLEPREIAEVVRFATRNPALNGAVLHANLGQREA